MRILTASLQNKLQNTKKAVEPVLVLGITWTTGTETLYSDRKLTLGTQQVIPNITQLGQVDTSQIVSGSGSSESLSVVMSDIEAADSGNGHLEDIVNNNDTHKAKARLYLLVQGVSLDDKTLIFQGEINSPLEWNEGDRTLSFSIVSQVESVEAGFAIEDGDFPNIPEELRGKPWPMVFGEACWEQAVQVRAPRKGYLLEAQGVVDFTLHERLCQARLLMCSEKYDPPRADAEADEQSGGDGCIRVRQKLPSGQVSTTCICDGNVGFCPPTSAPEDPRIDKDCLTRRFNEICKLLTRLAQEQARVVNPMNIRGGAAFPQNTPIRLWVDGVIFTGTMVGTVFTWDQVIHPQHDEVNNPPCKKIGESKFGYRRTAPQEGWERTGGNGRSFEYNGVPTSSAQCDSLSDADRQFKVIEGPGESFRYYEQFEAADFINLPEGTEVFLEDEAEILHIANLFGGTVTGVAAYRQFNDATLLVNLPTDYYTVRTTDYGDYDQVSEVSLTKPLNTYKDEEWESDIYVRVVSSVGPNPADCIKFLVDTYLATSGITMDLVSHAAVKTQLENYPIGTMIKERPSVFDLIADIAYQSRCAAVVRDGEMVLIYLAEEPTPTRTLTTADIVVGSMKITHGDTEELKTKHDISWQCAAASNNKEDDPEQRLLLKWNIPHYGSSKIDHDYYTQNTFATILKSATFWMIREATTWKYVHFETPLTQIDLDVFDSVSLNIPHFPGPTTVIVKEASLDLDSNTIKFKCWTPIRAGETIPYVWAWPAAQDALEVFPLQGTDDGRSGDALGFEVSPPLGHVLRGGYTDDTQGIVHTAGDRFPSDLGDSLQECICPDANDADIEVPLTVAEFEDFKELANRQDDHFENNQPNHGASGGTDSDKEESSCGGGIGVGGCTYQVTVTTIVPTKVTSTILPEGSCPAGGPCNCNQAGRPCTGTQSRFCHTFGARFAATQFAAEKNAEANTLFSQCLYTCGTSNTWGAGNLKAIPGEGAGSGDCENSGSGDPESPGAGDGEIALKQPGS